MAKGERTLRAVHPNAGIRGVYKQRLVRLIERMHKAVLRQLGSAYRKNKPEVTEISEDDEILVIARDALPSRELQRAVRKLVRRWQRQFDEGAPRLAKWFAQSAAARSDRMLAQILREAGYSVNFKLTKTQRDVINAIIEENVSLIRSIPQRYFTQIEGMVMRSVMRGGDLQQLTKDLQKEFRVTRRRAIFIARDQNIKAVSALTRTRQIELGVKEAIWMHSHAGKEPRKTHLANDGKRYDVVKGWFDPDPKVRARIFPGQLINCRCGSKSIIPGWGT